MGSGLNLLIWFVSPQFWLHGEGSAPQELDFTVVSTSIYRITMALAKGVKAPDFTLKSKQPEGLVDIKLSDNLGVRPTVLLFFPLAFTSVCEAELCSIRDSMKDYEQLAAAVYGISVDSPFSLEVFGRQNKLNFPLLSDFNKEVSKAYDVLYADLLGFKGVSKRSAFVVGKDGSILYSSSSDDPKVLPDFEAVKAALAG
jgi:peroxiredoxin